MRAWNCSIRSLSGWIAFLGPSSAPRIYLSQIFFVTLPAYSICSATLIAVKQSIARFNPFLTPIRNIARTLPFFPRRIRSKQLVFLAVIPPYELNLLTRHLQHIREHLL